MALKMVNDGKAVKSGQDRKGKQKKGFYVPTTRRNYFIEVYSVLGMALFLIIVLLIKGKPLNIAYSIGILLISIVTFKMVQYLLTKKSISYWRMDFWIEEGEDAKMDAISNLVCLLFGLFVWILL